MGKVIANEVRKGMAIKWKNDVCLILETQHVKPGKGGAYIQATLRSLGNGRSLDERFRSTEQIETVNVSHDKWEFSYQDQDGYVFMDPNTYENLTLGNDIVKSTKDYLVENLQCEIVFVEGRAVEVELPPTVELKVKESPEGIRGDSTSNVMKPATLETGVNVQVPLFIKEGETIKVDTRTNKYISRA